MCALLNLIVDNKNTKEAESDVELDENKLAAERDHSEAQRQLDGEPSSSKTPTRKKVRGKQAKDAMDQTVVNAGKRDADAADAEKPPPPKCPVPEKIDLAVGDKEGAKEEPANIQVPN